MSDEELIRDLEGVGLPKHVGIIIDGNRRWAESKGLPAMKGHTRGFELLKEIIEFAFKAGIKHLSIYALSIKNLERSESEVKHLFNLLSNGLKSFVNNKELKKHEVRIKVLGRLNLLPVKLQDSIKDAEEATKDYSKCFLNLCIAYDGQEELVDAVKAVVNEGLKSESVNKEVIKKHLYTRDSPEADLIIRTGMSDGARISGFLLWDASYSEFIFREDYWPDYTKEKLTDDLKKFAMRNRRFGK